MALPVTAAQNIQGLGIAGFRKDRQQLIFVRIKNAKKARKLLAVLAPRTANAWEVKQFNELFSEIRSRGHEGEGTVKATWIATLVSASGFTNLGIGLDDLPAGEAREAFVAGMAARAGKIGDTRAGDAPEQWLKEFRPGAGVDMLIVVASDDHDEMAKVLKEIHQDISAHGCEAVFEERGHTLAGQMTGREHFGFKDGGSQPAIDGWDKPPEAGEPAAVPLGEFVLGYPDASGQTVAVGDFWRDGSFVVFRRLRQDVAGFRQQAATGLPGSDPALDAATTAAKLVGRWPSGASLETSPTSDDGNVTNAFAYAEDSEGLNVPRFAHVRKANPRDEPRVDLASEPTERHRMLRRGIPYGPALAEGVTTEDAKDRGLHFIAVVADPARQFEFVQRQWLNDPNFPNGAVPAGPDQPYDPPPTPGELADGPDPLAGEFDAGAQDALHQQSGVHPFPVMHEIVTVTAGEYFFAPSLSGLSQLAKDEKPKHAVEAGTPGTPSSAAHAASNEA